MCALRQVRCDLVDADNVGSDAKVVEPIDNHGPDRPRVLQSRTPFDAFSRAGDGAGVGVGVGVGVGDTGVGVPGDCELTGGVYTVGGGVNGVAVGDGIASAIGAGFATAVGAAEAVGAAVAVESGSAPD